tara:strand:+ start:968 stop:1348 length:381 start_codon:yes stop_codon:yes gene_type:complete
MSLQNIQRLNKEIFLKIAEMQNNVKKETDIDVIKQMVNEFCEENKNRCRGIYDSVEALQAPSDVLKTPNSSLVDSTPLSNSPPGYGRNNETPWNDLTEDAKREERKKLRREANETDNDNTKKELLF